MGLFDSLSQAGNDALFASAQRVAEQYFAPLYERIRADLLARVTGDPPPSFAANLAAQGWPIDDAGAAVLWRALIAAATDAPPIQPLALAAAPEPSMNGAG